LETFSTGARVDALREVVLYQGEAAKKSHRQLFSLGDGCYQSVCGNMSESILSVDLENVSKLHISAGWEAMLEVALWTTGKPTVHEVLGLLRKSGVTDQELVPFAKSEVRDIFPWLYYARRFDVLRKVCNTAKAKTEMRLARKNVLVYCHMVSEEIEKIVASNL